jgi:hypothetical protein
MRSQKSRFKKNFKKYLKIYKFYKWKYNKIINKVYLIWMIRNVYSVVNLNYKVIIELYE